MLCKKCSGKRWLDGDDYARHTPHAARSRVISHTPYVTAARFSRSAGSLALCAPRATRRYCAQAGRWLWPLNSGTRRELWPYPSRRLSPTESFSFLAVAKRRVLIDMVGSEWQSDRGYRLVTQSTSRSLWHGVRTTIESRQEEKDGPHAVNVAAASAKTSAKRFLLLPLLQPTRGARQVNRASLNASLVGCPFFSSVRRVPSR